MDETILSLAIVANVCNFAYNVPFVYVVVKHNSAANISMKFLYLRIFGSIIWVLYAIFTIELYVAISNAVTLLSSSIIYYIKVKELIRVKNKEEETLNETNDDKKKLLEIIEKQPDLISQILNSFDCDYDCETNNDVSSLKITEI
tara:strand:+ start:664 stop:1098 length:435 start_codon:yes stop_codon:yes gene_type:complete